MRQTVPDIKNPLAILHPQVWMIPLGGVYQNPGRAFFKQPIIGDVLLGGANDTQVVQRHEGWWTYKYDHTKATTCSSIADRLDINCIVSTIAKRRARLAARVRDKQHSPLIHHKCQTQTFITEFADLCCSPRRFSLNLSGEPCRPFSDAGKMLNSSKGSTTLIKCRNLPHSILLLRKNC